MLGSLKGGQITVGKGIRSSSQNWWQAIPATLVMLQFPPASRLHPFAKASQDRGPLCIYIYIYMYTCEHYIYIYIYMYVKISIFLSRLTSAFGALLCESPFEVMLS